MIVKRVVVCYWSSFNASSDALVILIYFNISRRSFSVAWSLSRSFSVPSWRRFLISAWTSKSSLLIFSSYWFFCALNYSISAWSCDNVSILVSRFLTVSASAFYIFSMVSAISFDLATSYSFKVLLIRSFSILSLSASLRSSKPLYLSYCNSS